LPSRKVHDGDDSVNGAWRVQVTVQEGGVTVELGSGRVLGAPVVQAPPGWRKLCFFRVAGWKEFYLRIIT
jgi:hypothetical protein